jgi:hypothetical protein
MPVLGCTTRVASSWDTTGSSSDDDDDAEAW